MYFVSLELPPPFALMDNYFSWGTNNGNENNETLKQIKNCLTKCTHYSNISFNTKL